MKKIILSVLLLSTLLLSSCANSGSSENYEKVIGACLSQTTVTPFGVYLRQRLEEQCEAKGWKLICLDAERDAAKQQSQVEAMLQMDIDLFLYWPVERSAGAGNCQTFKAEGTPVVIINADVAEGGIEYTDAFVGPDQYSMAYDIGTYLVETTPEGGSVVMINGGVSSTQFIERRQGFVDAIEGSGLKLLQVEYSESDRSRAQTIMENYLALYEDIDILYCASDNLALGAVSAIEAAGRRDIRVVSIDGMAEAFQLIREGRMELTVLQTPSAMAEKFIETAEAIFAGEILPDRLCFSNYTVITRENVDEHTPEY